MADHADEVTLVPNDGWDPRILVCRCGPLVDTFVIVTDRYVVLVDTLINPRTATAMLEIAREHLGGGRQLLAINTHADWDHCWGNQLFAGPQPAHQAPIVATRLCAERLNAPEERQMLETMREQEPARFGDVQLVPPTVLFDERLTIDGGDLTLDLFATPGHKPDHISIFIPQIKTLLAGDAAEFPIPFVESAGTLQAMRESLAHMAALNPATALYCHAPPSSGPRLLHANIAYFDTLRQRCLTAIGSGVLKPGIAAEDIEKLVAFPFEEVLPPGTQLPDPEFYRQGHRDAIRAMLEHLQELFSFPPPRL